MSDLILDFIDRAESLGIGWFFLGLVLCVCACPHVRMCACVCMHACVRACAFTQDLTTPTGGMALWFWVKKLYLVNPFEATCIYLA